MVTGIRWIGLSGVVLLVWYSMRPVCLAEGWWVKAGPVVRVGMEAEATGASHTQADAAHVAPTLRVPGSVGSARSYADRTYDDGYVRRDPGTGDPSALGPEVTWYWGYDSASQFDSAAQTLTFHARGGYGHSTVLDESLSIDDDMTGVGLELCAGYPIYSGAVRIDLSLGIQGLRGADAHMSGSTYREEVGRLDVTDVYDVSRTTVPGSPYRGTYDGPFDDPPVIPSPTIPNVPSSRSVRGVDLQQSAYNAIAFDVDTDVYQAWIGPRVLLNPSARVQFLLLPKLSLNYVRVDVARSESLVAFHSNGRTDLLNSWHDRGDEGDFLFGAGMTVGADIAFGADYFAGVFAGYEWISDEVDVDVGPNRISVDAGGISAGILVGKEL